MTRTIFSVWEKNLYRSPENKLKAKYHICWKMNRNEVTLRWLMSWKPATHFDYQKKLAGDQSIWLNIYMYIVCICFLKNNWWSWGLASCVWFLLISISKETFFWTTLQVYHQLYQVSYFSVNTCTKKTMPKQN